MITDSFDPDKDILAENYPGTKQVRLMRCIPCGEVIYEILPGDSSGVKRGKWDAMALHMVLMHDSEVREDRALCMRKVGK